MTAEVMVGLRYAVAATLLWWLGAAARRALYPASEPLGASIATDLVSGATLCALLGTVQLILGLEVQRAPSYLVALGATAVAWCRRTTAIVVPRARPTPLVVGLWLCAGAGVGALLWAARRDALWWDGWAIWAFKARVLFLEGSLSREVLSSTGSYAFTHPRYPVGVPIVTWWFHRHVGWLAPQTASLVGAFWFATLVGLVWETTRRHRDGWLAALVTAAVAWLDPVASHALGGTAEVVIAIALVGTVAALAAPRSDREAPWRCGLFLLLGVLAKQEGLALAVVTCLGLLVTGRLRSHASRAAWGFAVGVPITVWIGWQLYVAPSAASEPLVRGTVSMALLLERIGDIGSAGWLVLTAGRWWPILALGLLALIAARREGTPLPMGWLVVAGYLAAVHLVYLLTPLDHAWLLRTSYVRVLSATLPAVLVLALHTFPRSSDR